MVNNPIIDIIIPNYNKGKYIEECLDSVLNQTYKYWKIYLVDDCSSDNSKEILKRYANKENINLFFLKDNLGPSYCRNYGIKNSNSEFVSFLDADDYWPKNKLQNQVQTMLKNNFEFTFTDLKYFYNDKKELINLTSLPKNYNFKKFVNSSTMSISSIVVKRKIISDIQFKNVKHEDYLFKCEILKKGVIANKIENTFVYYRINKRNRSLNKVSNVINLWKINRDENKFNFFKNLTSVFNIALNSFKTYGWK